MGDVTATLGDMMVPISPQHGAPLGAIALHATTYRLEVRGRGVGSGAFLTFYGEIDNPIRAFLVESREKLAACLPDDVAEYVDMRNKESSSAAE